MSEKITNENSHQNVSHEMVGLGERLKVSEQATTNGCPL